MAKMRTLMVSGINMRVHSRHAPEEYVELWRALAKMKKPKPRGVTALMIGSQRRLKPEDPDSPFFGYLYRFVNIDPDDPWFDIETQKRAVAEDVAKVSIPKKLKPNLTEIPYLFDVARHHLYFVSGGTGASVSPGAVDSLIEYLGEFDRIKDRFGRIDRTILTREGTLEALLKWPEIREIKVLLERPNPTEFDDDDAFYKRLQRRSVHKEEHSFFKAPEAETITPDAEMKSMFSRAVSDGLYKQRGLNTKGKLEEASSSDYPRKEVGEYDPDIQLESDAFVELVTRKFG